MIAKFPGKCVHCGKPITVGKDTYDYKRKVSFHEECQEKAESRPSDEQFRIAAACHFRGWDELERDGIPAIWKCLQVLSFAINSGPTGNDSAPRGLFDAP